MFKTNSNLSNLADQHGGEDQPPSQSSSDSATGGMGIKTMRRVYQNKHVIKTIQTSKQTGKMFCQTWYQNKQTNRWDVLSKHDIKSNKKCYQDMISKQTNRWDVLSNMISNQRWYQNKPTNKQVFSKQTCHLLNCYKWIFHGSKLLNFPESI